MSYPRPFRRPRPSLRLAAGLVLLALPGLAPAAPVDDEPPPVHRVERGPDALPLTLPIGERLEYAATLRTALADVVVGRVELSSGVDAYRPSLLSSAANRGSGDTGWVRARAYGDYTVYVMDARLESRFQPQAWPFLVHSFRQEGTEKRRREILAGEKGGEWISSYRKDTSRGAPEGLRVWGESSEQPVPRGAVDSLSAVYLVRSAIAAGLSETRFAMLDKERVWDVRVTLGEPEPVETPAGRFSGRPVRLETARLDAGGDGDEEDDAGQFAGPFGIRGDLRLWLEEHTGVPLVIKGQLPVLLGDLTIDLALVEHAGTPAAFRAIGAGEPAGSGAPGGR